MDAAIVQPIHKLKREWITKETRRRPRNRAVLSQERVHVGDAGEGEPFEALGVKSEVSRWGTRRQVVGLLRRPCLRVGLFPLASTTPQEVLIRFRLLRSFFGLRPDGCFQLHQKFPGSRIRLRACSAEAYQGEWWEGGGGGREEGRRRRRRGGGGRKGKRTIQKAKSS